MRQVLISSTYRDEEVNLEYICHQFKCLHCYTRVTRLEYRLFSFLVAIVLNNLIRLCQCSSALGYYFFLADNSALRSLLDTLILKVYESISDKIYRGYFNSKLSN